jgi:hypothetical protein
MARSVGNNGYSSRTQRRLIAERWQKAQANYIISKSTSKKYAKWFIPVTETITHMVTRFAASLSWHARRLKRNGMVY